MCNKLGDIIPLNCHLSMQILPLKWNNLLLMQFGRKGFHRFLPCKPALCINNFFKKKTGTFFQRLYNALSHDFYFSIRLSMYSVVVIGVNQKVRD